MKSKQGVAEQRGSYGHQIQKTDDRVQGVSALVKNLCAQQYKGGMGGVVKQTYSKRAALENMISGQRITKKEIKSISQAGKSGFVAQQARRLGLPTMIKQ